MWQPTGGVVNGQPVLWITYVRPDAVHTSLLAGVAHLDMSHLTATLHAGTQVPGGGPWMHGAKIATADYPYVVAAFNSAFRLDNSRGGYYAEGRTVQPLVPGRASFVTYANGHVDVGLWGRDDAMRPGVTAVRQNLTLIVDRGALVSGLVDASSGMWGGTVGNQIYVWRSGVGVDAHGNLIYAAGPGLNVETLAEILRRAGCVRAMELDINTWWVSFTVYAPDCTAASSPPTCSRRWSGHPTGTSWMAPATSSRSTPATNPCRGGWVTSCVRRVRRRERVWPGGGARRGSGWPGRW